MRCIFISIDKIFNAIQQVQCYCKKSLVSSFLWHMQSNFVFVVVEGFKNVHHSYVGIGVQKDFA